MDLNYAYLNFTFLEIVGKFKINTGGSVEKERLQTFRASFNVLMKGCALKAKGFKGKWWFLHHLNQHLLGRFSLNHMLYIRFSAQFLNLGYLIIASYSYTCRALT
jgi:hypothetical protein